MEKNYFNKAYIYLVAIFAIGVAIGNIVSFFHGVGIAFIGASVLLLLAISSILKSDNKKRFGDILGLIAIEFLMLIILFFAFDFNLNGITNKFPLVMRNICAIYSLLALGYTIFRYVSEKMDKKYTFVEYMLGNYTPSQKTKKEKKSKPSKAEIRRNRELENGTLEPKPSSIEKPAENTVESKETEQAENTSTEMTSAETQEDVAERPAQPTNNTTNRTGYWY